MLSWLVSEDAGFSAPTYHIKNSQLHKRQTGKLGRIKYRFVACLLVILLHKICICFQKCTEENDNKYTVCNGKDFIVRTLGSCVHVKANS